MPKLTRTKLLKLENHEELTHSFFPEEEGFRVKPEKGFHGEIYVVINENGDEACVAPSTENPSAQKYRKFFGKMGVEYIFVYQSGERLLILKEDVDDLGKLKPHSVKIPWTKDGITRTFLTALKNLEYGVFESFDELFERKEVTKKFYDEYIREFDALMDGITGIEDYQEKRHFAQILADRLIFLHFIQEKGLLDNNNRFLQELAAKTKKEFYSTALKRLFIALNTTGVNKPRYGKVPYLNGSLFRKTEVEKEYPDITVDNTALSRFMDFLGGGRWNWHIDEKTEPEDENTLDPQLLGHIFEKTVNQKEFGAYYTPKTITGYLAKRTVHPRLLEKWGRKESTLREALENATERELLVFVEDVLADIKILDNACGSGAFLLSALETLSTIWKHITENVEDKSDLIELLKPSGEEDEAWEYAIVKHIVTHNIYGVDLEPGAGEIAKLRLWLAMIAHAPNDPEKVEPLPNIDFKIRTGDSLLGFTSISKGNLPPPAFLKEIEIDDTIFKNLPHEASEHIKKEVGNERIIPQIIEARKILMEHHQQTRSSKEAEAYENAIRHIDDKLKPELDQLFIDKIKDELGEEWKKEFTANNDQFTIFHWPMEFPKVFPENEKTQTGFDCLIGNPPWEKVKTELQDFHKPYDSRLKGSKRTLNANQVREIIQEIWEKNPEIKEQWEYKRTYCNLMSVYFGNEKLWPAQKSIIDGKTKSSDPNFYKVFAERYDKVLAPNGKLGVVMHGGLYFSQGTKGLREYYWNNWQWEELLGYWNKKKIFENVDSRLRFLLLVGLSQGKTTQTQCFFFAEKAEEVHTKTRITITPEEIKEISPKDNAYQEIHSEAEKTLILAQFEFDTLQEISSLLKFTTETHQTNDREHISTTDTGTPYYRGEMMWQYNPNYSEPVDWIKPSIKEKMKRLTKLHQSLDNEPEKLENECYRIGLRRVSSGTNERTLIASILPPPTYCANTVYICAPFKLDEKGNTKYLDSEIILSTLGFLNSLTVDYFMRKKVESTIYVRQLEELRIPTPPQIPKKDKATFLWSIYDQIKDHCKKFKPTEPRPKELDKMSQWQKRIEIERIAAQTYGITKKEFKAIAQSFDKNDMKTLDLIQATLEKL